MTVYLKPPGRHLKKVEWEISERVRNIVEIYAKYAECTPSRAVDRFLELNLPNDPEFLDWLDGQRYNKRMLSKLGLDRRPKAQDDKAKAPAQKK